MFVGLQSLVHSIKGDLVKKMKEHRDEYLGIFNQSEEERARSEKIRHDKLESDSFNINQALKQIERKVELEQDSRIKNEDEIRKFMETKFYHLSEQHKQDEKMVLEREKRIMNQV